MPFFGSVIMFLGFFIIISNCLLPYLVYREPNLRVTHNWIKVSLAFADMLNGIVLVCSVLPNILWFRNLPEREVASEIAKETNSVTAVFLGSLLIVSNQGSLLHLTFLTTERLVAINWPMNHKALEQTIIYHGIAVVWILSIFCSFTPAIFPDHFEYSLAPVAFVNMLTTKNLPDGSMGYHGALYGVVTILLPYSIMLLTSITTGFIVWKKLRNSPRTCRVPKEQDHATRGSLESIVDYLRQVPELHPEIKVFKTLIIMIVAFSVTLLPVSVILILYNLKKYYNCDNYSLPYTLAFYIGISNSFLNVIIYTVRDKSFRKACRNEFPRIFRKKKNNENMRRKIEINSTSSNVL
uniref:high-affinity lysophosphatidic acid receptor-like n=1 Tax=Styela clava TaxID=7725 RepID=UPI001939D1A2|nr:high-affinity lysophosphatidic acid receptor-like [Styela clava]